MNKQVFRILYIILSFVYFTAKAQITANPSTGCAPETINFTAPNGATGCNWNFGNSATSTLVNPSITYNTPGNYVVTLNCSAGTFTLSMVIKPKPIANFSYVQPTSGCAVKTVTFTDLSTVPGGGAITAWTWSYGDGGSGNLGGTSTYGYGIAGSFSTNLIVTANGCSSDPKVLGPIIVSNPPNVIISSTGLSSCVAPFTTAFSASNCTSGSPTGNVLTYNWAFGNGNTSTQVTPGNQTYAAQGAYNVTLTVTDNNNCKGTANALVSVLQPSVLVKMKDTVCFGFPLFIRDSSNVPFTTWNMGNGSPLITNFIPFTTTSTPIYTYPAPGAYVMTITATSGTCSAVKVKNIFVQQVIASFTTTPPTYTCSKTFLAPMINQSSGGASTYFWTYNYYQNMPVSGFTSTATNPTFTFVAGSLNPYHIYSLYSPTICLIAKSHFGCISQQTCTITDSIRRPTAWFYMNKKEGCVPLTVNFRDSIFTNSVVYPVTSYTWNNGANPATLVSGIVPPPIIKPTFTYTATGTYTPYLVIQTQGGCRDTSFVDTVHVVNPPIVSFNVSPLNPCWNQPIQITNTSPATNPPIQHWHVDSDNDYFSHCVTDKNPSALFTHFGPHTFTMSAYLHGCKGTSVSSTTVNVKGPIVQSRYRTNCAKPLRKVVTFFTQLQDGTGGTINFGDGNFVTFAGTTNTTVAHTVTHTYAATGDYTAVVTASNTSNGCPPYTYTMLVTVRDADANFTVPSVACSSIVVNYNGSASNNVLTGTGYDYSWYFDNTPPLTTSLSTLNHTITAPGIHTVTLLVKDINSCRDTMTRLFRISKAVPNFTWTNPLCLSQGTITFTNTSLQTPDPINTYTWVFGTNNSTITTNVTATQTLDLNGLSVASPNQSFTVHLIGQNSIGCRDTSKQTIVIGNPNANFSPSQSFFCVNTVSGTPITFNAPSGNTSYTYNFGQGSPLVTASNSAIYSYTNAGNFPVTVQVQDASGCINSSQITISSGNFPVANFAINSPASTSTNNLCSGTPLTFVDMSTIVPSTVTLNYNWDLGTGGPIVPQPSVTMTYSTATNTVVTISHTVTTPFGCSSVITKTVGLFYAKADAVSNKSVVCLGESITLNIKDSVGLNQWIWSFGDGITSTTTPSPSNPAFTVHPYNSVPSSGFYTVVLTYYSSQNACKYPVAIPIQVKSVAAKFDRNTETLVSDSIHCLGLTDLFKDKTPPTGGGFTYSWLFGDGGSSAQANPSYTYPNSGIYTVSLTVTDAIDNCKGVSLKQMTINPLPKVVINNPDSVCRGATFFLTSNATSTAGITGYTWTPSIGLASPNSSSTSATATSSPQYTLNVSDANGCKSFTNSSLYIQQPPDNIEWDSTVVIGETIPMNGYAGLNMSYTWTPATDLNCINCIYPISSSTSNIIYTVTVADNLGCFRVQNTYTVLIDPKTSVDVPTAFTPNGDGKNDIIYPDGWGIKKLEYFRIYNRWGQLLFESNDINVGWDGTYKGVPQNMETYVYQVLVETYTDKKGLFKTGTFKLIR